MEASTGVSIHNSTKNCMYTVIQCAFQAEIGKQFINHFKICTVYSKVKIRCLIKMWCLVLLRGWFLFNVNCLPIHVSYLQSNIDRTQQIIYALWQSPWHLS